jgi:hypothetical protein
MFGIIWWGPAPLKHLGNTRKFSVFIYQNTLSKCHSDLRKFATLWQLEPVEGINRWI